MDRQKTKKRTDSHFPAYPLAELHAHLGTSIDPAVLWQIAHNLGVKLPKSEYQEFRNYVMLSPSRPMALNDYFKKIYHPLLDKLSSGTMAVESATYSTISGAYRNGISLIELRNNPMRHNLDAEVDLDHLLMAMLRGMERALLEHHNLSAGLILCLGREFDVAKNMAIIDKAIKYHKRGIIAIDVAGAGTADFHFKDYADAFRDAKKAGLAVTVHSGEVHDANDMWEAIEYIQPARFGHGILAAYDKPLMKELSKRGIVLEICPLSNLVTKAVKNTDELKYILRTLVENKVKFCINTDWPEVITNGHLRRQYNMLLTKGILSEEELKTCTRTAFESSFIPRNGLEAYL